MAGSLTRSRSTLTFSDALEYPLDETLAQEQPLVLKLLKLCTYLDDQSLSLCAHQQADSTDNP